MFAAYTLTYRHILVQLPLVAVFAKRLEALRSQLVVVKKSAMEPGFSEAFQPAISKLQILAFYVGLRRCGFEVENLDVLCWVWRCGLKLKILTFYVRIWCCCLKLWFEVENLDVVCWVSAALTTGGPALVALRSSAPATFGSTSSTLPRLLLCLCHRVGHCSCKETAQQEWLGQ